MDELARKEGKPRWAEKTPGNIAHIDRIWKAWPDAQIVHIIRDPRDIFASLVEAKKWDTRRRIRRPLGRHHRTWRAPAGRAEAGRAVLHRHPLRRPDRRAGGHHAARDRIPAASRGSRRSASFSGTAGGFRQGAGSDRQGVHHAGAPEGAAHRRARRHLAAGSVGRRNWRAIQQAVAARGFADLYERVTAERPAA